MIAWAPEDRPTEDGVGGLEPDRYSWTVVLHRDHGGGVHVHVMTARCDLETDRLTIRRQCALLGIYRSSVYYITAPGGGVEQWLLWVLHDRGAPATAYASGPLHVASADSRECRNRTAPACAAGTGPDAGGAETPVEQK